MTKTKSLVSIVIVTKNEEKHIENCLNSIRAQTYPKIETIVIDNHSTDRTKEIAKKFTKKVFNKGPERSAQRNFGMIKKSKGEFVLYLDADMILSPTLVADSVKLIEKTKSIALHISEVVMGDSLWSKARRHERSFYDGTVIDCVRFISRKAFIKVGGFDESMTGPEDWDLDKKIRQFGKTALLKTPIFHNEAEFNLHKYLSKKGYYSKSFDKYINKWGKDDVDVRKQFSPIYRYVLVFIENGKWKKVMSHPLESIVMILLRLLVGVVYVTRK
jgi:glycosyltransferase involved in cell wall biosynthesis